MCERILVIRCADDAEPGQAYSTERTFPAAALVSHNSPQFCSGSEQMRATPATNGNACVPAEPENHHNHVNRCIQRDRLVFSTQFAEVMCRSNKTKGTRTEVSGSELGLAGRANESSLPESAASPQHQFPIAQHFRMLISPI